MMGFGISKLCISVLDGALYMGNVSTLGHDGASYNRTFYNGDW